MAQEPGGGTADGGAGVQRGHAAMLVPCAGPTAAIFTAPLFFGVGMATRCSGCSYSVNTDDFMCLSSQLPSAVVPAHLHHITEQQRLHKDSMSIVLTVSGQWTAHLTRSRVGL